MSITLMEKDETKRSATEATGYIAGVGVGMTRSIVGMTRSMLGGKPISASIIVLAAAILIVGGSHIVQIVGCIVGLIGLAGWFVSSREN